MTGLSATICFVMRVLLQLLHSSSYTAIHVTSSMLTMLSNLHGSHNLHVHALQTKPDLHQ